MPVENLEEPDASTAMARKRFISSSLQIHVERIEADLWALLFSSVSLIVELPSSCFFFLPPYCFSFLKVFYDHFFSWLVKKYQFVKVLWSLDYLFSSLCYSFHWFCFLFHLLFFIFFFRLSVFLNVYLCVNVGSCFSYFTYVDRFVLFL